MHEQRRPLGDEAAAAERRRAARLAVTQALAEAATLEEAVPRVLETLAEGLGWDVGGLWHVDPDGGVLRCAAVWHRPGISAPEFEALTRRMTFPRSVGLPGRVWAAGRPTWIPDVPRDDNFPRAPVAEREGLHGAFAFPVVLGDEVLGVLEFFSREIREPDADLLEMTTTVGSQVGHFIGRKQAEERLRVSEERFARFMQHLPGLAWIKDLQGRYVYANDAALKAFRKAREQLYGRTDDEVFPPQTAAQFRENDRRALAGGTGFQTLETLEHEDGVLHYSLVSKFPIPGAGGTPTLVGGMAIDITEQQRTHHNLEESERRFRQLADAMPQIVWTARPDGYTDYYNRRWYEFTGFPEGKGGDESFKPILHPDDVQRCMDTWHEAVRSCRAYEIEYRFWDRGTGQYRWHLGRALPVRDAAGNVTRWFGTSTDIDDQKRAEEALREADRRKDEFLAMLAHELRNPMAPIRNAAQVIRLVGAADPNLQRSTELIERQVKHMTRLVDDLLDVSRITRGKITLQKESVELAAVIARAVETTRPLIDSRKHELSVTLPPESLRVEGDSTRLAQVIANLLNNAAKYTPEGGHIWVTALRDGAEAVVRVRDDGVGVPREMLSSIFELFTQVDRSLARSEGGLGIGLTLVKSLVELHGGRVEAQSDGPGTGTEVAVWLPLSESRDAPDAATTRPVSSPVPARRVLIVDDNLDGADSLGELLRLQGHKVSTAHDGPSGIEAARQFGPEVILLDIGLPGMSGYEVARQLRQDPDLGKVLLVALTGYGQDEDRRNALECGFDAHLTKPADPATLQRLLTRGAANNVL